MGHDDEWANNARNATKGSCNIYFSRLADRIENKELQHWLFKFGFGREVELAPAGIFSNNLSRQFRQVPGTISSKNSKKEINSFEDLEPLFEYERRWFGIGQGNLRVTPLQVANSMAVIARGGVYKKPRLISNDENTETSDLGISPASIAVVREGMSAVVNEYQGTANTVFKDILQSFTEQGVKVFGKTGSTEAPEHAWFAGFVEDNNNRGIAISLIVEGGQHGSSDAAPLARDIIQFCIDDGYIGKRQRISE
jgi:penicillin-binding protein 2